VNLYELFFTETRKKNRRNGRIFFTGIRKKKEKKLNYNPGEKNSNHGIAAVHCRWRIRCTEYSYVFNIRVISSNDSYVFNIRVISSNDCV
jgi:hypothetical protein